MRVNTKTIAAAAVLCIAAWLIWSLRDQDVHADPLAQAQDEASQPSARPKAELAVGRTSPALQVDPAPPLKREEASAASEEELEEALEVAAEEATKPAKVTRSFSLRMHFTNIEQGPPAVGTGEDTTSRLYWLHTQSQKYTDLIFGIGDQAPFERTLSGDWKTQYNLSWVSDDGFSTPLNYVHQSTGSSPLNKRTLAFEFDELGGWRVKLKAKTAKDRSEILKGVRRDLDFPEFAPPRLPFIGDVWIVEGAPLCDLFQPGGELHVEFESNAGRRSKRWGTEGLEDVLVKYPVPIGQLELTSTGPVIESWLPQGEGFTAHIEVSFASTIHYSTPAIYEHSLIEAFEQRLKLIGDGDGTWNLEAARLRNLKLKGDVVLTQVTKVVKADPREGRYLGTFELSVSNSWQH